MTHKVSHKEFESEKEPQKRYLPEEFKVTLTYIFVTNFFSDVSAITG